jgi:hypothetical protein
MSAARPLRIGLDISSAFARNSGISFYVENLVAGLVEVNKMPRPVSVWLTAKKRRARRSTNLRMPGYEEFRLWCACRTK